MGGDGEEDVVTMTRVVSIGEGGGRKKMEEEPCGVGSEVTSLSCGFLVKGLPLFIQDQ